MEGGKEEEMGDICNTLNNKNIYIFKNGEFPHKIKNKQHKEQHTSPQPLSVGCSDYFQFSAAQFKVLS